MILKLIGTDGKKEYNWDLKPGKYIIGRTSEADFFIENNTVSRKHAQLELTADKKCFLTDLGSHNGTYVNDVSLTSCIEIKIGSRILFGETDFRLADDSETSSFASRPITTQLIDREPEKSVLLDIKEALKPLPSKVTERPEVLTTLFDMAKRLTLDEPKQLMMERSLGLIANVVPAERYIILTSNDSDNDSKELYITASHIPGGKDGGSLTLSRTIINDILTNKQAIVIEDSANNSKFANQESIVISKMKSAMAVPLFEEGEVLGILYVDTTSPLHHYNDEYLKLLAIFGNIIASRLINYVLMEERAEKQLMEAEINRATEIQKRLLDISYPEVNGYEVHAFQKQCRAVGGDMYDMCLLEDGSFLFLVADVSGKGMGAALLMSNILASLRILYQQKEISLTHLVEQVSAQLFMSSKPEDFATLFLGIINPNDNKLRYINAGHNPAFLVRKSGENNLLTASGVMIGAFGLMNWEESQLDFESDDVLVVYSDGVTEAEKEDNAQYGEDRLYDLIKRSLTESPQVICENLVRDIDDFVEGYPPSDDVTMLVIKRTVS